MAEDQPAFFDIRHIGVGDQPDDRPLHRPGDLDAGFHRQPAAYRQRVDRRIVEQTLEGQDAALDLELLAEGIVAPALRPYPAAGPRQVAALGAQADAAGQTGFEAKTGEVEIPPRSLSTHRDRAVAGNRSAPPRRRRP